MKKLVRKPLPKGLGFMDDKLHFAVDLYQGNPEYYDRYPLPYPEAMIEDLIARTGVSGQGRLLDLACGTGQLALPRAGPSRKSGPAARTAHRREPRPPTPHSAVEQLSGRARGIPVDAEGVGSLREFFAEAGPISDLVVTVTRRGGAGPLEQLVESDLHGGLRLT
jgi:hypothetical protein